MNAPAKLAGYAVVLAAVFGVGAGLGAAVGPAPSAERTDDPAIHAPAPADSHDSGMHDPATHDPDAGHGG